jgi:A/G-specific adenine glycosylase
VDAAAEDAPRYEALTRDEAGLAAFRGLVLDHYRREGRSFPWRETRDPWAILVSEVMLQQTQTDRVVPKYLAWMAAYPEPGALAAAPLPEVLGLWSGLGYNRRALALVKSAGAIAQGLRSGAGFPREEASLLELPGIGPYTARAVLAFAFDEPVALIETNVRSAYLQHYFPGEAGVSDARIMPLVAESVAIAGVGPRTWYYALMDYGADLKRRLGNPNARSAHYARQSPFADSHRRIRGAILRELGKGPLGKDELAAALPFARERVEKALAELRREGFVSEGDGLVRLG